METIEITSESIEMAFSGFMFSFASLQYYIYPSVFTHFSSSWANTLLPYVLTYIPLYHICLDCRGLEELFHKKKTWLFIVMDPMRVSCFKLSNSADSKYVPMILSKEEWSGVTGYS